MVPNFPNHQQVLWIPIWKNCPTDYTAGVDFRLNKTSKGGYADYSTSNWARRERPLGDAEMQAVNTHGLFNLSDFLPKKPDETGVKVMQEMFEASVDGQPATLIWSRHYSLAVWRLEQVIRGSGKSNATAVSRVRATSNLHSGNFPFQRQKRPAAAETAPASDGNAQDIPAMIRTFQHNNQNYVGEQSSHFGLTRRNYG